MVIRERIRNATGGTPSVTTIEAVFAALDYVEAGRLALLVPYPTEVEQPEIEFLDRHGHTRDQPTWLLAHVSLLPVNMLHRADRSSHALRPPTRWLQTAS